MNIPMYVEINVFAFMILFIIYLNIHHQAEKYLTEQKLFLALLGLNALILIFDTFMWVLDGKTGLLNREFYFFVTVMYYILNPLVCMTWSFYADYQINRDERRLKKLLIPMFIPVIINAILSCSSIFNNWMFYIDKNNVYHRGNFFYIMAFISYLYLVCTLIIIIIKQKQIQKNYFIPILVFAFPPFIGGIIQVLYYGLSLIWVCMTISIFIIFINIQNDQLYTDHLTGLFNRRQLDSYLREHFQSTRNNRLLAGIMIDLDCFKLINDKYGHNVGDQALIHTAKILRKSFNKNAFIYRYGGDEFVIILEARELPDLKESIELLNENVTQFNAQENTPYSIKLSVGADYYDRKLDLSVPDFLKRIDTLMYQDKRKKMF